MLTIRKSKVAIAAQHSSNFTDIDESLFNLFYGASQTGPNTLVEINEDFVCNVFITRPNLCLDDDNIAHVLELRHLIDNNSKSLNTAIRTALTSPQFRRFSPVSELFNDKFPFISYMCNSWDEISGWPDRAADFFISEEGLRNEVYLYPDFVPENARNFVLNITFQATKGNPQQETLNVIREYMGRVGTGEIYPHPVSQNEYEVDSTINIYIILSDRNKKYVQQIASLALGGYFGGDTGGQAFNINRRQMMQDQTRTISTTMTCSGFYYNHPYNVVNFNDTVAAYNPDMKLMMDEVEVQQAGLSEHGTMVKIADEDKGAMANYGYPYINPYTSELEWWTERTTYDTVMEKLSGITSSITEDTEEYIRDEQEGAPDVGYANQLNNIAGFTQ